MWPRGLLFFFYSTCLFINFAQACLSLETVFQVSDVAHGILLNLNAIISLLDSVTLVTIKTYLHHIQTICITQGHTGKICVTERVTDDFLKYTYNRLKEIDSKRMCVEPWPPKKSLSSDGTKLVRISFFSYKTASSIKHYCIYKTIYLSCSTIDSLDQLAFSIQFSINIAGKLLVLTLNCSMSLQITWTLSIQQVGYSAASEQKMSGFLKQRLVRPCCFQGYIS